MLLVLSLLLVSAVALLVRVRENASTPDVPEALARCPGDAALPGTRWPDRLIDALCHDAYEPVLAGSSLPQWIHVDQWAELDARLHDVVAAHARGALGEGAALRAFAPVNNAGLAAQGLVRYWRDGAPDSPFARVAEGLHLTAKLRVSEDPTAQAAMMAPAIEHLRTALAREPALLVAWMALIDLGRLSGARDLQDEALAGALAVFPDAYGPRERYLQGLRPEWGGNVEAMQAFARAATQAAPDNPRMALLQAEADVAHHTATETASPPAPLEQTFARLQRTPARPLFSAAAHAALEAEQAERARDVASAGLTLYPDDDALLRARATALTRLERPVDALVDLDRLLLSRPADAGLLYEAAVQATAAGQLDDAERYLLRQLQVTPDPASAHLALARLYLYWLKRPSEARLQVSKGLRLAPESGELWLVQAELPTRNDHHDRAEAVRAFLKFVDRSKPSQRRSAELAAAWLAEFEAGQAGAPAPDTP